MSARWGFNKKDIQSAVRHTVLPILAGGAVAGMEAVQVGAVSGQTIKTAAITAILSGIIRALQRWTTDLQPDAPQR
jgi:outer membrane lipoprotein SlyB